MRRFCSTLVVTGLLAALLTAAPAWAQSGSNPGPDPFGVNPVFEQTIQDQLTKINPQAVPIFKQASDELNKNDYAAAERDFNAVLQLAPNFDHALRRLGYAEAAQNKFEQAVDHCRQAVKVNDNATNEDGLAEVLIRSNSSAASAEALTLARSAVEKDPADPYTGLLLAEAGLKNKDDDAIREGAQLMQKTAPDAGETHYFLAVAAMTRNDALTADDELTRAEQAGLPAASIEDIRSRSGIGRTAGLYRTLIGGGYGLVGWVVGFGVLLAVGALLSNLTLSAVRRMKPEATVRVSPAERTLRSLYRLVIVIGSLYFYVSIPLILLITLGLVGGIIYLILSSGYIPIQLLAILAIGTIYTLVTVIRSLFIRIKQVDPGPRLTREAAPQLWAIAEEVAARVETRPVDTIFVTPTTEVAVAERGRGLAGIGRQPERVLTIGLGSLPGMTVGQLKAVLAHEYGHFSNRDTAGGSLALRVRATIFSMARGLAVQRQNNWLNPVWLFLYGYSRLFARITLGASRLQEILADRTAALTYGASNLAEALEHIVRAAFQFNVIANTELRQAYQLKRPVANLYALQPPETESAAKALDERIRQEMSRPTSPYDSHPAMKDRLELIRALEPVAGGERNSKPAWDLLPNSEALQMQMSQALYKSATGGR